MHKAKRVRIINSPDPMMGVNTTSVQEEIELPSSSTHTMLAYEQSRYPSTILPKIGTANGVTQASTMQTTNSESYFGLVRGLVKNSGIYAISSLSSPLVTLLLAPFLTHILSHADYGALTILNGVVILVTGISELGLGMAFTRMYMYDCKGRREQLDALSTLVLLLLVILIPITIAGILTAPFLSTLILSSPSYSNAIRVGVVLVLTQNLTVPGLVWLRADSKAGFYSTISIANLLTTALGSILLVGMLHMGILGALVAYGIGDVIIIATTLPIIFGRAGFHLRFFMVTSMLAFGVPNIISLTSNWMLLVAGRYLLGHYVSLSLAAEYSVAYSVGGVLFAAIILPFSLTWWVIMFTIAKRSDAQKVFKLIFRYFSIILLFATLGLSLFGTSILNLLFPASYHAQSHIIPIIALSTMCNGIFITVNLGPPLRRKTWLTSLYFFFSALVNIGLNIVLIPVYGAMGAAIATLVAYTVLVLLAYFFNPRIYAVPFEMGQFLMNVGTGIALYLVCNEWIRMQSGIAIWVTHIGTLLFYGFYLLIISGLANIMIRSFCFKKRKI